MPLVDETPDVDDRAYIGGTWGMKAVARRPDRAANHEIVADVPGAWVHSGRHGQDAPRHDAVPGARAPSGPAQNARMDAARPSVTWPPVYPAGGRPYG